jgi:hypothetical protein
MMDRQTLDRHRKSGVPNLDILQMLGDNDPNLSTRIQSQILGNPSLEEWEKEKAAEYYLDKKYSKPPSVTPAARQATSMLKPNRIGDDIVAELAARKGTRGPGLFDRIGQDIHESASQLNEASADFRSGRQDAVSATLQATGAFAGGVGKVLSEPIAPAVDAVVKSIQQNPGLLGPLIELVSRAIQPVAQKTNELALDHPVAAKNLRAAAQVVTLPLAMEGANQTLKGITKAGKKATQGVQQFMASDPVPATTPKVIQELVQPKVTSSSLKEATSKTPELVQKGVFGDAKILPGEREVRLAETAKTIKGFGQYRDPIKNAQVVKKAIGEESEALKKAFQANDAALPHKQMNAAINQRLKEIAKDFPGEEKVVNRIGELWKRATADAKGTISGHWQGRIGFDGDVESRFGPKIFEKGTARAEAVRAVRQTANDIIDQAAQKAGLSFSPQIKRLSDMFTILENLSTKASKAGTARKFLQSGAGRTAVGAAAGAAGLGAITSIIR